MLRDVAERFLRNAVEGQRGSRRQLLHVGVRLAGHWNAAGLAELSAIGGERLGQPRFVQRGGGQVVRGLADARSDLDQFVLHAVDLGVRRRARWNLVFDRPEIEGHRSELLEDAVVQLSGDAGPLLLLRLHQPFVQRRDLRLVPLHQSLIPLENSDADAVGGPEQCRRNGDTEGTEPGRLMEGRRDAEREGCAILVPDAAVVAGLHDEPVILGRQIRVAHVALVDQLAPVLVLALELDAEAHLFRCDKAQGGVVDREIAHACRQPQRPAARVVDLSVRGDLLDVHGRRQVVVRQAPRIDPGDSVASREPELPVGGPGHVRAIPADGRHFRDAVGSVAHGHPDRPPRPAPPRPPPPRATRDGITRIDPRRLPHNDLPPPVHIEQITADGKVYDAGSRALRLPARVRDLAIDYTALSLVAPEKVRFRIKLEGQDKDWRELVNERHVRYTNLPPKDYRFVVKASNNSGVWNEDGASLAFSIPPAFHETTWFRALCVAVAAALLWTAYRIRVGVLERNQRLMERHQAEITALNERLMKAQEEERTRIAGELHDGG